MRIQILIFGFKGLTGVRLRLRRRMTEDKRSTKFKHLRKKKTIYILVLRDPLFITSLFGTKAFNIQLFPERLSEKVHATIPKGIVDGFESDVPQRNLKELH